MTRVRYRMLGASALALCVLAGCSGDTPTEPTPVDIQVTLAPRQTARVDGTPLAVRFDGVSNDSRCPADAICITGGDAIVHVAVVSGGPESAYELHTGSLLPVRHDDVTIALADLQPYPFSARTIDPDEYRATLRVTR